VGELLGIDEVGVHDSFFELGGNSLMAIQVISQVRATFDVKVPLGDFLKAPTVANLAPQ
jgi:acyl carrier protein